MQSESRIWRLSNLFSICERQEIRTIVSKFLLGIMVSNMIQHVFCALTAIFTVQSALQPIVYFPQTQKQITREEERQAQDAADLFVKRLTETGDLAPVLDELFVADFIQRYVIHQTNIIRESNSHSDIFFAPGLWYKPDLLNRATIEDWRRFYIATYSFLYPCLIAFMNRFARDLMKGNIPDDVEIQSVFPSKTSSFFNAHPILKNLISMKGEQLPISTLEEMRSATATLEQGLRLLREELGSGRLKPSDDTKKVLESLKQSDLVKPFVEVSEKEFYGYPPRTRALLLQTPLMFALTLVDVNGRYKIVWAESAPGK